MLRVVFMGTPDFSVPTLMEIVGQGHEIAAVYTQPPRPAGRGMAERRSPVHDAADALMVDVRTPKTLRDDEALAALEALQADVVVVIAYGLLLPQMALDAAEAGAFNVHASLLPRWRGAAPIHRAIMAGDEETGGTIMQMEAGLDTGPMRHIVRTPIARKTTGELFGELAELGGAAMIDVLADLGAYPLAAQDDALATHAPKVDKAEARIDWSDDAATIDHLVRGLAPFPGAWFDLGEERVKLLLAETVEGSGTPGETLDERFTIACGSDALRPITLQRAGKPAMSLDDFLRGRPVEPGTILT